MSDKYLDAARLWIKNHGAWTCKDRDCGGAYWLADCIREYDSKRAAETCETCGHWFVTHYSDKHGECRVLDRYTKSTFGCVEYARRIVEKQAVTRSDTGTHTKSIVERPEE